LSKHITSTPEQPTDIESVTQAMRDALGVDQISPSEHAILVEAVADILSLRTGQKARRTEEAMLAYYLGFASCARLAEDFGPRSVPASLKDVGEHFTADEMGELMAPLDRVIARRRGEVAEGWKPVTLPVDAEGGAMIRHTEAGR
jgi:hypothetical protein